MRLRVISLGLQALVRRSLRFLLELEHGVEPLAYTDSARPSLGAPADFVAELEPRVVPRANAQVVVAAKARVEAARRRPRPIDLLRMPAGPQATSGFQEPIVQPRCSAQSVAAYVSECMK